MLLKFLDLINRIIAVFVGSLIFYFLETEEYLLIFKRLELGVSYFCMEKYEQTNYDYFLEQSKQEFNHSKVLDSILNPSNPRYRYPQDFGNTSRVDGYGTYQVDGISKRYFATKIFFLGKSADNFDLNNSLAFMGVLERFQYLVYREVLHFIPLEYQPYFEAITNDEKSHSDTLLSQVGEKLLVFNWNLRLIIAAPFLILDLFSLKVNK